jgi:hypothetical protein
MPKPGYKSITLPDRTYSLLREAAERYGTTLPEAPRVHGF